MKQDLTIGAANAGGGDNPFQAFTKIEANTTELYRLIVRDWNNQTDNYTIALTDIKGVIVNSATGKNITIPNDATVNFPIGTIIPIRRIGLGPITFVGGSGVTPIAVNGQLTDPGQNVDFYIEKIAANTWLIQNGFSVRTISECTHYISNTAGAAFVSTDQPNSERHLGNLAAMIQRVDLTYFQQWRLVMRVVVASASPNSPRAYPNYMTNLDGLGTWESMGDETVASGEAVSFATATYGASTNWTDIPSGAKADVLVTIFENGGNGAIDPSFLNVKMQYR